MNTRPGWLRRQLNERADVSDARLEYVAVASKLMRDDLTAVRANLAALTRDNLASLPLGVLTAACELIVDELGIRMAGYGPPRRHLRPVDQYDGGTPAELEPDPAPRPVLRLVPDAVHGR